MIGVTKLQLEQARNATPINYLLDGFDYAFNDPFSLKGYELDKLPTSVFFNKKKKATTLLFDDEVFVVKCDTKDTYNKRIGFLEAYFQAHSGMSKTQANKFLRELVE